uniref:Uncharacterized protein n=1 Tax=viral metagenome TaxID=1070528 RepID=A0A6C0J3Y8_9ZZZZ
MINDKSRLMTTIKTKYTVTDGYYIHNRKVVDVPNNYGCEQPPYNYEINPAGCQGYGCVRGNCAHCKKSQNYWEFCSTSDCYYHNCGDPLIRISTANIKKGNIVCKGCAKFIKRI